MFFVALRSFLSPFLSSSVSVSSSSTSPTTSSICQGGSHIYCIYKAINIRSHKSQSQKKSSDFREMGFSEEQEALVKESWEVMKQNIPDLSLRFFSSILEIAPEAKNMFSFLKDSDEVPQNNTKVKAHARIVFKMTCDSAVKLREKGEVVVSDVTLKHLGSVHVQKGVIEPQFEVVKEALLRTVKEAVGEKWNEEMKCAWGEAYDQLAAAIKAEMKKEANQLNPSTNPAN